MILKYVHSLGWVHYVMRHQAYACAIYTLKYAIFVVNFYYMYIRTTGAYVKLYTFGPFINMYVLQSDIFSVH